MKKEIYITWHPDDHTFILTFDKPEMACDENDVMLSITEEQARKLGWDMLE